MGLNSPFWDRRQPVSSALEARLLTMIDLGEDLKIVQNVVASVAESDDVVNLVANACLVR